MNRRPIGVLPFFFALALTGCNNDNVPAGYIGFEKGTAEWVYDKSKTTEEFSLKIVTGTKAGEDIPLVIESPNKSIVKLKTPAPQIPKGKKEMNVRKRPN